MTAAAMREDSGQIPGSDSSPGGQRPLRILHLIDSGGLYGAERLLLMLAQTQTLAGHRAVVGTIVSPADPGDPLGEAAARGGIENRRFVMPDGLNLRGLREILEYSRREGIDVIHSHGYKANILVALSPKRTRPAALATLHGWTSGARKFSRMYVYESLERLLLSRLDTVVAVSETMRIDARASRLARRLVVIPNGLESTKIGTAGDGDEIVEFVRARPSIACVGRLSNEKGVDRLIEALPEILATFPELRLVVLGEGPERGRLEAQADALGLAANVLFAGYCPNVRAYLPCFDVLVIPSRTEGLPLVALEAMAAGTVVAAAPVGAIPWVLDHGSCGVLFGAEGDAGAIAAGVVRALSDGAGREQWRVKARARMDEQFSAEKCAAAYESLYESIRRS